MPKSRVSNYSTYLSRYRVTRGDPRYPLTPTHLTSYPPGRRGNVVTARRCYIRAYLYLSGDQAEIAFPAEVLIEMKILIAVGKKAPTYFAYD